MQVKVQLKFAVALPKHMSYLSTKKRDLAA